MLYLQGREPEEPCGDEREERKRRERRERAKVEKKESEERGLCRQIRRSAPSLYTNSIHQLYAPTSIHSAPTSSLRPHTLVA
jgi:hypothetical protein